MITAQARATKARVHPLSALALALADWLVTGLNIATSMDAYWPVALGSGLFGALAIVWIERTLDEASSRAAAIKGACALALIALPFPLAGSVVALALLAWWLVDRLVHRH